MKIKAHCFSITCTAIMMFGCDALSAEIEQVIQASSEVPQTKQACMPGHKFSGAAGLGVGYDNNTRPPSETIKPGTGAGPGPPSQPLVETSQSDVSIKAHASLRHAYCLSGEEDDIAVMWISHVGVGDNRYLDLEGANEQNLNLSTGPMFASNWFWRVTPVLNFETARLQGASYRQRIGLSSHQLWNLAHNWQVSFRVSAGQLEFDQVPDTLHVEGHDKALFALHFAM